MKHSEDQSHMRIEGAEKLGRDQFHFRIKQKEYWENIHYLK